MRRWLELGLLDAQVAVPCPQRRVVLESIVVAVRGVRAKHWRPGTVIADADIRGPIGVQVTASLLAADRKLLLDLQRGGIGAHIAPTSALGGQSTRYRRLELVAFRNVTLAHI